MQKNISIRRNAQKLAKAGQVAKAIETYLPILEMDADPYDYLYVGDLCVKVGSVEKAVVHYQSAIAHYRKLGFNRNAIALCRKILRLDATLCDIHRLLGLLYAADDLVGDALESYALYLAGASDEERERQEFRDAVQHACELAPRRAGLALDLSEVLLELRRGDDAADVLLRSAEVAHRSGDGALASELLTKAAQIDPAVTERVGQMLASLEDPAGAQQEPVSDPACAAAAGRDVTEEEVIAEIHTTFDSITLENPYRAERGAGAEAPQRGSPDGAAEDGALAAQEADPEVSEPAGGETAFRETMTCSGVEESDGQVRRSISFREIELDESPSPPDDPAARQADDPATGQADNPVTGQADDPAARQADDPATGQADDPAAIANRGPAGGLADPAGATRAAIDAEQWTVAARRVEEWLHLESQSVEAAEKLVEISKALQDNAGVVRGLILLGDLHIQEGDLPAAVPHFRRAMEIDPDNDTVGRRMARFAELGIDEGRNEDPNDPGAVDKVLGSHRAVVDVRDAQADRDSGDGQHQEWMELGALLEEFQEGIRQQVGEDDAQAHYDLGVSHMEMELFEEALEQFELALAADEGGSAFARRLYELRGKCLSQLNRHREAIHEYRRGMETAEGSVAELNGLRYLLALEYQIVGETDAAKESLRELLREQPSFPAASALLAALEEKAA